MTLSFDELNWDTKPSSVQPLPPVSSRWPLTPRPTSSPSLTSSSCYWYWPAPPTWPPQYRVHRSEVNTAPGTRSRMPSRWELNLHTHLHPHASRRLLPSGGWRSTEGPHVQNRRWWSSQNLIDVHLHSYQKSLGRLDFLSVSINFSDRKPETLETKSKNMQICRPQTN